MFTKRVLCQSSTKKYTPHHARLKSVSASVVASSSLKRDENFNRSSESSSRRGLEPTLEIAKSMPTSFKSMDNLSLIVLANIDHPPISAARAEVLKRHIMSVDEVDYKTACETFAEISKKNMEFSFLLGLPYKLGMATAVTAGFASFPLVFHLDTVEWFNTHYVTTDVPEPQDLETVLEVGSWAWNWMEPPLGQISFFLLCLQFSRAQFNKLGMTPYTERVKAIRAEKLCAAFDKYDKNIVTSYSESSGFQH